jgi:penicillin amidase
MVAMKILIRRTYWVLLLFVGGCSLFQALPEPTTVDQRLDSFPTANLPLQGRTVIYWDEHQIPFVEAEYDTDAAFALGLVHAHLRLGHLALARLVTQGRMSEFLGHELYPVDRAIRTLDFDRAVPEIEANLPDDTRAWLEAFVAGINYYIANVDELPQEYQVLDIPREPWTVSDLIAFSRLAGSDANWPIWLTLLEYRQRDDWPEIWASLLEHGTTESVFLGSTDPDNYDRILQDYRQAGSNAFAVAGWKSRSGAPLLAADPHVGYLAQTIWLIAGLKSPSYHVVGVMPTGAPFFALGRNPDSAWGGTNLYAASSSFYDVSGLPEAEIDTRTERIEVGRNGYSVDLDVRDTDWGPIISDLPGIARYEIGDVALRWTGHMASDEFTAMLGANRATNFSEFREALKTYSIPGMNLIYAGVGGEIGHVLAVHVPNRPNVAPEDVVAQPEEVEPLWQDMLDATTLPANLNPPDAPTIGHASATFRSVCSFPPTTGSIVSDRF